MKIINLEAFGLRNIPDGSYSFLDPHTGEPASVVLVPANPGVGKTSFLRTIAAAKEACAGYGSTASLRPLVRDGESKARLAATWLLSESDAALGRADPGEHSTAIELGADGERREISPALHRVFERFSLDPSIGKFEFFPANRSLVTEAWRATPSPLSMAYERARRLTEDRTKYLSIARVLHDLVVEQASRTATLMEQRGIAIREGELDLFAAYKTAITTMVPNLRLLSVDVRNGAVEPLFLHRSGRKTRISELSASEEQGVLFAFVFAWLGLSNSVLLIDDPELHVPGSAHLDFLERLQNLGADNQIVCATGSDAILRATPKEGLLVLSGQHASKE